MKKVFLQYFNKIGIIAGLSVLIACEQKTIPASNAKQIQWVSSVERGLVLASQEKKGVMIDVWAEWCAACKELDATTYTDPKVVDFVSHYFVPVKLDYTDLDEAKQSFLRKYNVIGLPAIIFLDNKGQHMTKASFTGYIEGKKMIGVLKNAYDLLDASGECKSSAC